MASFVRRLSERDIVTMAVGDSIGAARTWRPGLRARRSAATWAAPAPTAVSLDFSCGPTSQPITLMWPPAPI